MTGEIFGEFDAILHHALDRHGFLDGGIVLSKCPPRPALVPLYEGEILFPSRKGVVGIGAQCVAWTAMKKQNRRICGITALDGDPLCDAADLDIGFLVYRRTRECPAGNR